MNTQPTKPDTYSNDGEADEDVGSPAAEVRERTKDEKNKNLNGKADTIT